MITTQQNRTAPVTSKPSYSIVLYDPSCLETLQADEADEADEHVAVKPVSPEKRPTKKAIAEKFNQTKKEFQGALLDIHRAGLEYNDTVAKIVEAIATPVANAAIPGLAKILGTYRTYFDNANTVERDKLFAILARQCKTDLGKSAIIRSDKRTTEWHLLSRMFRRSDRRQASADAKILKFAHTEGITEESFASWVKAHGTLSSILKRIPADDPVATPKPKTTTKAKPRYELVDRTNIPETEPQEALNAMKKLADGKVYQIHIFHHQGRFEIVRYKIASPKEPAITPAAKPISGAKSDVAPAAEKTDENFE